MAKLKDEPTAPPRPTRPQRVDVAERVLDLTADMATWARDHYAVLDRAGVAESKLRRLLDASRRLVDQALACQREIPEIVTRERAEKDGRSHEVVNREITELDCIVCEERPRRVRGMCDTDYRAWVRAGMPDIARFSYDRRHRHHEEAA